MNPLFAHPMGIGTWAWGDRLFWGYGRDYGEEDLRRAFLAALEAGILLFDTAEFYGSLTPQSSTGLAFRKGFSAASWPKPGQDPTW
jgi:aryl-alcohol dehydrogenase-like predicted oxidoreductase